jgi:hypothetical protein
VVKEAELDAGTRASAPTDMAMQPKALEHENRERRQANDILVTDTPKRFAQDFSHIDMYETGGSRWFATRADRIRPATRFLPRVHLMDAQSPAPDGVAQRETTRVPWVAPMDTITAMSIAQITQGSASPGDDGLGTFTGS